ncbi:MAG: response regulator [Desulfobacterales bacterium]
MKWGLNDSYDPVIADHPEKARQLLASGSFPVATLDLGLPPCPDTPQEGFRLLEETGRLAPHTKFIVITGNAEQENAIKAIGLGAADFCTKPVDLDMLKIILQRTFRISELETANRRLQEECEYGCCVLWHAGHFSADE